MSNLPDDMKDYAFFESHLFHLLQGHRDQYVIVYDEQFHGFFPTHEDAYKAALNQFGLGGKFLIQKITDEVLINHR